MSHSVCPIGAHQPKTTFGVQTSLVPPKNSAFALYKLGFSSKNQKRKRETETTEFAGQTDEP